MTISETMSSLDRAVDYLRAALAGGAAPSADLLDGASQIGISGRTLHRAKVMVGASSTNIGGKWHWALAAPIAKVAKERTAKVAKVAKPANVAKVAKVAKPANVAKVAKVAKPANVAKVAAHTTKVAKGLDPSQRLNGPWQHPAIANLASSAPEASELIRWAEAIPHFDGRRGRVDAVLAGPYRRWRKRRGDPLLASEVLAGEIDALREIMGATQ